MGFGTLTLERVCEWMQDCEWVLGSAGGPWPAREVKKYPSFHELLDAPDRLFVRLVHGYLHVFRAIFRCNCQAKRAIF